jgi:uroporphyrinogen decarboxylase
MTDKERVLAAIEGRAVDRVPLVPQLTYFALKFSDLEEKDLVENPGAMAACIAECGRHFGFDALYAGWESSFNILAEAVGCRVKASADFIAGEVEPLVKGRDDLSSLRVPDPEKHGRLPFHDALVRQLKELVGEEKLIFSYVPGPLTMAGLMIGLNDLMKNILLAPDFVHQLVERMVEPIQVFADMKIRAGADVIAIADPTASCSVISADMFKTFSAPYLAGLSAFIKARGAIPSLHICGKTLPVIGTARELGFSIFEVDHINDLEEVLQAADSGLCLQGNIDPSRLVMAESDEIYQLSMTALAQTAGRERFIFSSGCEVGKNTPDRNLEAMVKARHDFTASRQS